MKKSILVLLCMMEFSYSFAVKSLQEIHNQFVVRQNYEESCGASSLANLLNFFEFKQFSEQDILKLLQQKTDMLSFQELKEVATFLGYETKGFQLSRDILEKTSYPLLVRIEDDPRFPHFVVVINYEGDFIKILDPNFGEYIGTKKEFYSVWDRFNKGGYALLIARKDRKPPIIKKLEFPNKSFFK